MAHKPAPQSGHTATFPRGIAPETLLSQVKNTMPYLFEPATVETPLGELAPARVLREFESTTEVGTTPPSLSPSLSHFEYFRLCLSAHYLTVATPVPTDVDNQIRQKLWPAELPLEIALQMADLVIESRRYDFTLLTSRYVYGADGSEWEKVPLTAHAGEWFTLSCGAYCALKQYLNRDEQDLAAKKRQELLDLIADEVNKQSEVFGSLWRSGEGVKSLRAAANLAHNFGDLDRVMDMWALSTDDPLRRDFYKLGSLPFDSNGKLRYKGRLWVAGELYKSPIADGKTESSMALENHRHFALRKPKCLRRKHEYLIPMGPFFDDWGRLIGREFSEQEAPSKDLLEVVEALKHGWDRAPKTVGYGRALRTILEVHPGLEIPSLPKGDWRRAVLTVPQDRFEKKWGEEALRLMDEIPSRA
jgi:hypothetical protein